MRLKLLSLLLVPVYLVVFASGVAAPNTLADTPDTPTTTVGSLLADSATATESTEATKSTEPIVETTSPVEAVTEPTEIIQTEPQETTPVTEPENKNDGWTSLGTFKLTAYCSCKKCCGKYADNRPVDENGNEIVYTASGARAEAGVTIAVDPRVIPYGSQVQINGHTYIAQDTGGNIKKSRIDVYFDDHQAAWDFGVQYAEVFISVD